MHPWLSLPYSDEARVSALKIKYDLKALPTLVVLDGACTKVISEDSRQEVSAATTEESVKQKLVEWADKLKAQPEEEKKE